ncbi:fibronectin-III type domain-containing protein windei isoform X2 [Xylocopa sonorina]
MRLRLSDDEIEAEDIEVLVSDNQGSKETTNENEVMSEKNEDKEGSPVLENSEKNKTDAKEINQEEQCSGNVPTNEQILIVNEKSVKKLENRVIKPHVTSMPRPWLSYESQWRFTRSVSGRMFRGVNHSYNRYGYLTSRGHYRPHLYNYNMRFHNSFLPFERGRGNGMFDSYNRSMYGSRPPLTGFKPNVIKKPNSSAEFDQNPITPTKTNISIDIKVSKDVNIIKINDSKETDKDNTLNSESSSSTDKNNHTNEIEDTDTKNHHEETYVDNNVANNSLTLEKNLEENSKLIVSNNGNCKDITEVNSLSDGSNEKFINSATNSYDANVLVDKIENNCTNNTNHDSEKLCEESSDNSKQVEALNALDERCTPDKNVIMNDVDVNSMNNQEQDEAIKAIDIGIKNTELVEEISKSEEQKLDMNQESMVIDKKIELPEENCKSVTSSSSTEDQVINTELIINEEMVNHKVEQIFVHEKPEAFLQNAKLNEDSENDSLKAKITTSNDFTDNKDGNEIRIELNTKLEELVTNSNECDNDELKNSNDSTNSTNISKLVVSDDQLNHTKINLQEQNKDAAEEGREYTEKKNSGVNCENVELTLNENNLSSIKSQNDLINFVTNGKNDSSDSVKKTISRGVTVTDVSITTQKRRRRTKKMAAAAEAVSEEDKQVRESGRQKRRTAKNAEEIIRKKFLNNDSDLESSNDSEKFVVVNYKSSEDTCPVSPSSSLKRICPHDDKTVINGNIKKIKINSEAVSDKSKMKENNSENLKNLKYIHKFFQRDLNEKLPKLKQEELEELLIQKIVETITMRDEIGKLREQARISERNQEVTRAKCQQLAKQIKDFEMVLSRNAADRRANNDKRTPPIKINRSVGLQVNFVTDHGVQNLRQLQQNSNMRSLHVSNSNNIVNTSINEPNNASSPRRGIKVRSPRRTESTCGQTPTIMSQNHTQSSNITSTITPAALVVTRTKPLDTQHSLTLANQTSVQQIISTQQTQPQLQQPQQGLTLNGKFSNQINRQVPITTNVIKSRTNDLIDLTDEEEKSKVTGVPVVTTTITDQQLNLAQKTQQPCFQRVIQTIPGNVAIASQPPSIRVVQPASQPTPTALVNNMNAPRLAYVMQSGVPTRQLLIAPNTTTIRPVTSCRTSFSTLTYKTGISTIANGTVRVLTTPATTNVQLNKHPAPLPDIRNYAVNSLWKLPPPAPSLKISKVAHGIVLSWNMNLSDKYADIASYQLYAYQEIAGVPPNTSLWKKVGDVRALPLPMACTLTQFSEGNNYYFAVRAVDTYSRKGQYSIPGNISL